MQIEITGFSNIARWLPFHHALQPLVALVAFLHQRKLIKTGLSRPTDDWPIAVDHLPVRLLPAAGGALARGRWRVRAYRAPW